MNARHTGSSLRQREIFDLKVESVQRRRTYEVSTGRPKKQFAGDRLTEKYFDVSLLDFNEATGEMVRSPALCIGEGRKYL